MSARSPKLESRTQGTPSQAVKVRLMGNGLTVSTGRPYVVRAPSDEAFAELKSLLSSKGVVIKAEAPGRRAVSIAPGSQNLVRQLRRKGLTVQPEVQYAADAG